MALTPRTPHKSEKEIQKSAAPDKLTFEVPTDLSAFALEQFALEVRFPLALNLWDKAGALWRPVREKWPDLHLVTADPGKTTFQMGRTVFIVEMKAARIVSVNPSQSLDELSTMAREFFRLTTMHLEVTLYERLGLRLIYFKEYKDRKTAASAFHSLRLVKVPNSRKFEVDDEPVNPQYILRWESDKKGAFIQCKAETRKIDWDPPIEQAQIFTPIHTERNGIVIDLDYYTVAPVEPGQVDMGEWVKHSTHVIERDTRYLFEG